MAGLSLPVDEDEGDKVQGSGDDENSAAERQAAQRRLDEERIRRLATVVCICKGIRLGRILKALEGAKSVADVNRNCGSGSGGCAGQRCGPRIKKLLSIRDQGKVLSAADSDQIEDKSQGE